MSCNCCLPYCYYCNPVVLKTTTTSTTTLCPNPIECDSIDLCKCIKYNGIDWDCFNIHNGDGLCDVIENIFNIVPTTTTTTSSSTTTTTTLITTTTSTSTTTTTTLPQCDFDFILDKCTTTTTTTILPTTTTSTSTSTTTTTSSTTTTTTLAPFEPCYCFTVTSFDVGALFKYIDCNGYYIGDITLPPFTQFSDCGTNVKTKNGFVSVGNECNPSCTSGYFCYYINVDSTNNFTLGWTDIHDEFNYLNFPDGFTNGTLFIVCAKYNSISIDTNIPISVIQGQPCEETIECPYWCYSPTNDQAFCNGCVMNGISSFTIAPKYSECDPITVGCHFYNDEALTILSNDGYYTPGDGYIYTVIGGEITSIDLIQDHCPTTTTTINPCGCITFTNHDLINSQYVEWDVCPDIPAMGNYTIAANSTFKACGSNPRSDAFPPGTVTWEIGGSCDLTNPYPTCSVPKCHVIITTVEDLSSSSVITYYDMYGEFQILTVTADQTDNICAQEGSITITCTGTANSYVDSIGGVCTYAEECPITTTTTIIPLLPTSCTAIGYGMYKMENFWSDDQLPNPPDGIYTFQIVDMTLDGISYGTGSTITITAPNDLVVGPGVKSPGTFVMNINDWLNLIPGVAASGFAFYDDMSTIDCPDVLSSYSIIIQRTVDRIASVFYYRYVKESGGTTGWYFSPTPISPSDPAGCYNGCWGCSPIP